MGCCGSTPCFGDLEIPLPEDIEQLFGQRQQSSKDALVGNAEAMGVISRSFCGTEKTAPEGTLDWVLGPLLKERWEDSRRAAFMDWFSQIVICVCYMASGFILGARREGSLAAVVVVCPCPKGHSDGSLCEKFRAFKSMDMPPKTALGETYAGIMARLSAIESLGKAHKKICPGPHAYVLAMAVDPSAQGFGLCGKLMRLVNDYAESLQLPLYLETSGSRNVAIYEHFGYKAVEQMTLSCPKDPDKAQDSTDEYAMIRTPVGQSNAWQ
eukprot:TRINITY_DN49548_c0_g1_i1.p1 TRINITY_DN49548_c0_g1~~TRINITY_DN49548_c0_g1_i1.p1  ORF type:complete len:279 (+),score=41.82 TRINITY_DN49548_c0_g1_i1:35-838(+)